MVTILTSQSVQTVIILVTADILQESDLYWHISLLLYCFVTTRGCSVILSSDLVA
jgi:hypothetical protein